MGILTTFISLILGGFIGWFIAGCFHKRQMRASKQSQEAINTYFQRIESKMTEGFTMLWEALNPGQVITSEAKTNIQKASTTISSAFLEPIYAAGTILAGDAFASYLYPQKSAAERKSNDQDDKPPKIEIHKE